MLAMVICAINIIGFYYLHRIKIDIPASENKNEIFQFKPFNSIGDISLTRKQEIINQ
jgi:hypothetical protein